MTRDPSTMAVGPAARKALQVLLDRGDPLEPIQAGVLARRIGVRASNVASALRKLTGAGIVSKENAGAGFPTWWRLEPAALHHAHELSTRLHERTSASEGREGGSVELPVWLAGHPAKVYSQAWRELKRAAAIRGA